MAVAAGTSPMSLRQSSSGRYARTTSAASEAVLSPVLAPVLKALRFRSTLEALEPSPVADCITEAGLGGNIDK